jgi:hypothetical protein
MIRKLILITLIALISYFSCISQTDDLVNDSTGNISQEQDTSVKLSKDNYLLDSLKTVMSNYAQECFGLELSYTGYESSNGETWYYDSLAVLRGYHSSWTMEASSGEEYYWFDNGKLFAVYEERYGQTDIAETIFISNVKDNNKLENYELAINRQQESIYKLISENLDKKSENDDLITITIEETHNYGTDFTETTIISLDRYLYDLLFRD